MSQFYFLQEEAEVKDLIQKGKLKVKDYYSLEKSKHKLVYRLDKIEGEGDKLKYFAMPLKVS